jgi:hypothetical protein
MATIRKIVECCAMTITPVWHDRSCSIKRQMEKLPKQRRRARYQVTKVLLKYTTEQTTFHCSEAAMKMQRVCDL